MAMPSFSSGAEQAQRLPVGLAWSLGLIMLLGPTSIDMYLPSMPEMALQLDTSFAKVQLSLTVFLLAMGAGQLLFGPVIDAYGRRIPLLVALVAFVLASLGAALAPTIESLIVARLLQGLASSLAIVTAMSSVRDMTHGMVAAQLFAVLMAIQGIAPVFAPAIGGVIGAQRSWRMVFVLLAVLGILVFVNTLLAMRETLPPQRRSALQLAGIMRTYAEIVSSRRFILPAMSLALVFFFLFFYIGGASYAYQKHFNLSTQNFGLVFGGTGIAMLIGAMSSARLVTRYRADVLALVGVSAVVLGAMVSTLSMVWGAGLAGVVAGMFIAMGAVGVAEATLMAIALASRNTALGASAAILGAAPLMLGAVATPLAAIVVERGTLHWLIGLIVIGLSALLLTGMGFQRTAQAALQVD